MLLIEWETLLWGFLKTNKNWCAVGLIQWDIVSPGLTVGKCTKYIKQCLQSKQLPPGLMLL